MSPTNLAADSSKDLAMLEDAGGSHGIAPSDNLLEELSVSLRESLETLAYVTESGAEDSQLRS